MIQMILCDDQAAHNQTLKTMLNAIIAQYKLDAEITCVATRYEQALAYALENPGPSIFFLDICLDEASLDDPDGIALCKNIRSVNAQAFIVYVSAYPRYGLDACRSHAFDFLVKPFSDKQLTACVLSAMEEIKRSREGMQFSVKAGSRIIMLDACDVLFFEKEHNFISAVMHSGEITVWRESFSDLLRRLYPDLFVQIHRGFIVGVKWIREVSFVDSRVTLLTGATLPLSRRCEKRLRDALGSDLPT